MNLDLTLGDVEYPDDYAEQGAAEDSIFLLLK
jgi:hypothetical protein